MKTDRAAILGAFKSGKYWDKRKGKKKMERTKSQTTVVWLTTTGSEKVVNVSEQEQDGV